MLFAIIFVLFSLFSDEMDLVEIHFIYMLCFGCSLMQEQ